MFVAIKDNKIIAHNETGEFPCLVCDEIKEIDDVTLVQVDGEFLPDTDEKAIEKKKGDIRLIRNKYLEDYVDYYQCKPMLRNELTEDEKQSIADYRVYLKDYPNSEKWWENKPLTYEEWKNNN